MYKKYERATGSLQSEREITNFLLQDCLISYFFFKTMSNSILRFLRQIDIFAQPVHVLINNEQKYGSLVGACLTVTV